jgi:hypothetical protein
MAEFPNTHHYQPIPPASCLKSLWLIDIPTQLKELLWKWTLRALPLGHRYYSQSDLGCFCKCGSELSLPHLWRSCLKYDLSDLLAQTDTAILACIPAECPPGLIRASNSTTLYWFPLLSIDILETSAYAKSPKLKHIAASRQLRCQLLGHMLWHIWSQRMKELFDSSFTFVLASTTSTLAQLLKKDHQHWHQKSPWP